MNTVKINVNTDIETKSKVEAILDELGLNMTTAINIYLKKILAEGGIPFDLTTRMTNAVTIAAQEEGDRLLADPARKTYKSIEELKAAMDL